MTPSPPDADAPLSDPPDVVPRLGLLPEGLALSTSAGDSPYLIEGARVAVAGPQKGSVDTVQIDGLIVAGNVSAALGQPVNITLSPGRLRREWVGTSGTALEIVLAAASLPLVAIQWVIPAGGFGPVSLTLLPGTRPLHYHAEPGSIVATRSEVTDRVTAIVMSPPPEKWSVDDAPEGGLRVAVQSTTPGHLTLLLTSGSRAEVAAALQVAEHLEGQERRATAFGTDRGLRITSGVSDLDDGVAWARARLAAGLSRAARLSGDERPEPSTILWSGIGALAVGDSDAARQSLSGLDAEAAWPYGAILGGKLALLTGDTGAAFRFADMVWNDAVPSAGRKPDDPSLLRLALRALADGLSNAAPKPLVAKLRQAADDSGASGPHRRLPTLGNQSAPPDLGSWLEDALSGVCRTPLSEVAGLGLSISAWGRSGSDPEEAWATWRGELSAGLRDGPSGPGTWDPWRPAGGTPITGVILATLVHGFLGVAPDAPAGRIRIGPRLPAHLTRLRAVGLTVADAEIDLAYERLRSGHRFTLEPKRGSMPPVAVFQPELPGRVARVRIDGKPADLITSVVGARSTISVQIPVDSVRTVEIDTE